MTASLLALVSILLCDPTGIASQQAVDITGAPTCRDCYLEFRRITLLGSVDGEGALAGEPTSVAQDSRGNYYVTQFMDRSQILVFTRTGQFVQRLGKTGRGPGEFSRIAFVVAGVGDSLYVFDPGNARLTVLTPTYGVARTAAISGQYFGAVHSPDGRFVANAHLPARDRVGQPLQTLSRDGHSQITYGALKPEYRPDVPYSVMRTLASAGDNRVWSGYKTRYAIEEWSADGRPLRTVSRTVPWFTSYERRRQITQMQAAEPWLMALHQDANGLLWSAVTVPADDWAQRWAELGLDERKGIASDQRMHDTMIEVLDVRGRQVVVSQRVPQNILGFLNDSTSFSYHVDDDEVPHIEIWRSRLVRGNAKK